MTIISYNVNGLRAAIRRGFLRWLAEFDADVVCLQEVKALPSEVPVAAFEALGYRCYFAPAQKRGYSGVAIFSRLPVRKVTVGCGIEKYDREGRFLQIDTDEASVVSVYMPSGSSGEVRQAFKMDFLKDFLDYTENLLKNCPKLVISGDFNICHHAIDIHDPIGNKNSSGFLIEEREWLSKWLKKGFIDTFRHFSSDEKSYTWWSYRAQARARNLGWRIDYHMASTSLENSLQRSQILSDLHHSDHCPIILRLKNWISN